MFLKRQPVLVAVFVVLALTLSCGAPRAEVGWRLLREGTVERSAMDMFAPSAAAVGFINEKTGLAAMYPFEIQITENGVDWRKIETQAVPMLYPDAIEMLDEHTFWCKGSKPLIMTTDGGHSWKLLSKFGVYYSNSVSLTFVDERRGWFGSKKAIFMTGDGGTTWEKIPLPIVTDETIIAACLSPGGIGHVLFQDGMFFRTENEGADWSRIDLPLAGRRIQDTEMVNGFSAAIRFQDRDSGAVVLSVTDPVKELIVLSTTDGGETWRETKLPDLGHPLMGSVFLSRDGRYLTVKDVITETVFLFERVD